MTMDAADRSRYKYRFMLSRFTNLAGERVSQVMLNGLPICAETTDDLTASLLAHRKYDESPRPKSLVEFENYAAAAGRPASTTFLAAEA